MDFSLKCFLYENTGLSGGKLDSYQKKTDEKFKEGTSQLKRSADLGVWNKDLNKIADGLNGVIHLQSKSNSAKMIED